MEGLKSTDPRRVGRYRISALLGAGGMGRVFLGRSPSGRLVAVKVVRPELAEDPGFRRRFAQEVASARKVTGFFTAAVVDADPDGSPPWLATAYVPGMALDQAVAAHGPWPVESVRALGAGLAEALEAIHAAGLVHRDLKPSNVLIAPDGPRVVDFGISLATESTALTRAGTILGTPGFMAPEQLTDGSVTPATDVFAFGAVLTYAATGTGPFGTGSAQSLNFRIAYEEPRLGQLPGPGLEIIARCLAKEAADRPSVDELIEELAQLSDPAGYTPTEIVTETPAWLPDQVARALPATIGAPAVPAAPTHRPPKPRPQSSKPSKPSRPSNPKVAPPSAPPAPSVADKPTTAAPAVKATRPARSVPSARATSTKPKQATPARRPQRPPAAQQPTTTAPPSRMRSRTAPFWTAGGALTLALCLPFYGRFWLLETPLEPYWQYFTAWPFGGSWPFILATVLGLATCAAALSAMHRSPRGPVPVWIRRLHFLSITISPALFIYWVALQFGGIIGLQGLNWGSGFFALGCGALVRGTLRLRAPKQPRTP